MVSSGLTPFSGTGIVHPANINVQKGDSYFQNGTFIKDWLDSKTWIHESKKFGKTRECRICHNKLSRNEKYLNLDQSSGYCGRKPIHRYIPVQVTVCESCVTNWANKLKELNNDLQRNSTSGF